MPSSGRSWNRWVKKCGGTVRTPHGQERCTSPFIPSQHSPLTFGFCLNPRCDSFWRTKGERLHLPLPVQLTPFQAMMLEEHEHEGHVTLPPSPGHRPGEIKATVVEQPEEMDALEWIPSLAALRDKLEDLETIERQPWVCKQPRFLQEVELAAARLKKGSQDVVVPSPL